MTGSSHEGIVRHHDEPQIVLDHIHELHDFGWAITRLKTGGLVRRRGWNGKGMWLRIVLPRNPYFLPYIQMKTVQDQFVPWLASQTDMLADDWESAE